jgi:hypothetical protein
MTQCVENIAFNRFFCVCMIYCGQNKTYLKFIVDRAKLFYHMSSQLLLPDTRLLETSQTFISQPNGP